MGDAAKRRKRAKEKALEARRRRGVSPWVLLGKSHGECAVFINANWRENRLMSMWVFRPSLTGGWAAAAFLIDFDCLGLKDAFVVDDCPRSRITQHMAEEGGVERVSLEDARRWVAAAIRWTREHDFRLPASHDKALAMLGGIGDWQLADTSGFAPDGKLRYIGRLQDLERRLIGRSAQEFFEQEHAEYLMELNADESAFSEEIEDEEGEINPDIQGLVEFGTNMGGRAAGWLISRGKKPHPLLDLAAPMVMSAMVLARNAPKDQAVDAFVDAFNECLIKAPDEMQEELNEAGIQFAEFVASIGPSDAIRSFAEALGLSPKGQEPIPVDSVSSPATSESST